MSNNYILTSSGSFVSEDELYHHGIKGMKWGVRRFQNEDGTLTDAGKKRVSKKYEKASDAVLNDLKKQGNTMYLNAYNRAADYMNSGGIDKFNAEQRKKYGEDYAKRDDYTNDYYSAFEKQLAKNYNRSLNDFYRSNKNVAKAQALVDKYNMTSWNEMAKSNSETIKELRRVVEEDE